jgi:hypothetical protein
MSNGFAFFRMGVIKLADVSGAIKHNRRAIAAELDGRHGIDPELTYLNYTLHGRATADDVQLEFNGFKADITNFGSKLIRKDAVWLNEIVISVARYDKLTNDPERLRAYFKDACAFVKRHFEPDCLISFDVHMDEEHPHAHALILPMLNGKMDGSKINKPLNQARLRKLLVSDVGINYGYKSTKLRTSKATADKLYETVITFRRNSPDDYHRLTFDIERDNIRKSPTLYAAAIGIEIVEALPADSNQKTRDDHISEFISIASSKGQGSFHK